MPVTLALTQVIDGEVAGGSWSTLLLYVSFALFTSFLCSLLEASLLSSSRSYVESRANEGSASARLLLRHKLNVESSITAILTLNTIANTLGATFAGAEAAKIFGSDAVGIISAVLTLMVLVFSEIIPKTLGAIYWQTLIPFTAYALQVMLTVLAPFVWVFRRIGDWLRPDQEQPTITRNELSALATIGEQEGTLKAHESRVLRSLLRLESVSAADVLTPRPVVLAFSETMTVGQVMEKQPALPYSRLPVYVGNMDNITGYVLRHDVLKAAAADRLDTPLTELRKPIDAVPETMRLPQVLDRFVAARAHILLVIDEFGGTAGILTLEDAIETLLGVEILDESDAHPDLRELAFQRRLLLTTPQDDVTTPNITPALTG
jgi:CBS domain containing-hemolysin-like protein